MANENNNAFGVKWGFIIGFVYCILLLVRYKLGENDPLMFSIYTLLGYLIILTLLIIAAFRLKKESNGYIELQNAFRVLFISVLIFELFYTVFNFIYLKYINPNFFQVFHDSMEAFLEKTGQSQDKIDKTLSNIDVDAGRKMNIFDLLKSYLFAIAISGAFAFLFALIIRKKKDPFKEQQDHFLQA